MVRSLWKNEYFKGRVIVVASIAIMLGLIFFIDSLDIKNPYLVRLYFIIGIFTITSASYCLYKYKKNNTDE